MLLARWENPMKKNHSKDRFQIRAVATVSIGNILSTRTLKFDDSPIIISFSAEATARINARGGKEVFYED